MEVRGVEFKRWRLSIESRFMVRISNVLSSSKKISDNNSAIAIVELFENVVLHRV